MDPSTAIAPEHRATVDLRLREVERRLLSGHSPSEIRTFACEAWDVGERTARRLVAEARKRIAGDWDVERPTMCASMLSRLDSIARKAEEDRNFAAAVGALKLQAAIAKLI